MNKYENAIIIPLYNEEKVIRNILIQLKEMYPAFAIIVVDDKSTDNSYKEACLEDIYLLKHSVNLGQGATLQTGIEFAKQIGCKYVITFDSDGQHSPEDIKTFIKELSKDNYDIILGSRFLGKTENMAKKKKILLKFSRIFTWITTGIWLSDSHNGFRVINIKDFPDFEIR